MASSSSSGVKKKFPQFDVVKDASDHKYFATKEEVASGSPLYKAIVKEWKILQEHLPESIYVRVYETRMELMRAVIVGPPGTPYHDGLFFFDILFPSDYPQRPPTVTYWSYGYRLNPNLYNEGYVCLSLLNTWNGNGNEKWVPKESTLLQLLVSLEGLVLNEKPYFNEPDYASKDNNVMFAEESQKYNETAFVFSLKTMSCLLRKPLRNFEDFISEHFRDRSRTILTSCQAYINGFLVVGQYRDGHTFLEKRVKVKESLKTSLEPCYKSLSKAFKKNDPSLGDILDKLNQLVETTKGEYKRRKKERKEERKRRKIEEEREEERKRRKIEQEREEERKIKQDRKEERKRRKIEQEREEERKIKQDRKEERKRRKIEQEREEERKIKQDRKEEKKRRKTEEEREEGRKINQEGKE